VGRQTYVADQDLGRVTLTAPFINPLALLAFLVAGQGKAEPNSFNRNQASSLAD
jgi:6-phosphogluconolactonase/glucosamine-6-phosphate isomerase/deaminase